MRTVISAESWLFTIFTFLLAVHHIHSFTKFECLNKKGNAPKLPDSYSTNIRINYMSQQYTVEVHYAINKKEGKELLEFIRQDRHVKYITRNGEKATLLILYEKESHPTCKVIKSSDRKEFLEDVDAGKNRIILKAFEVMMFPDMFNMYSVEPSTETGVFALRYEGCLSEPRINISLSFAVDTWKQTHTTSLIKDVKYPDMAVAEIGDVYITALYSYFDPTVPDDSMFQPPADVYCKGFRADKKPPPFPNFFSYEAEMIVYESSMGIAPIVSRRQVYYDFPAGISRVDFDDPLADNSDLFSPVIAKQKSIIHDFKAGVQFISNPTTGKCNLDTFKATFNAISFEIKDDDKMYNGDEFFWLKGSDTSYNGQFPCRGLTADVYTAMRVDPSTQKRKIVSWYFSTEETRIAENENVEKNVLLRMYVRPETDMDKTDVVEVNFYNFVREAPSVFTYDITSCFNDSFSKSLVFTFPAIDALRGSEKMVGMFIHLAILNTTRVRKQRIYMKEVVFSGKYMYAEFRLLDILPEKVKGNDKYFETTLEDALNFLQYAVDHGIFTVKIPMGTETYTLKPEPNGLNIFSGDRNTNPSVIGYKEGSVIGLTIGMLFLGFLLGAVTLNLVVSRKYGVSLFQKSFKGNSEFGNPLNESSI